MTNQTIGKYAAGITALSTLIFAIAMLLPDQSLSNLISYSICILLSWGYLSMVCAFVSSSKQRDASLYIALSFAIVYVVYICFIYYTQLTTVYHKAASEDILSTLTYAPGSFAFAFDLFGYGMLAVSTFFLGLSLVPENRAEQWFRYLLLGHGIFAPVSVLLPVFDVFGSMNQGTVSSGTVSSVDIGILVLEVWCLIFFPIMLLGVNYFQRKSM